MKINTVKDKVIRGAWIEYNDGRPGHAGVKAEVLEVTPHSMIVQFEDRADTTKIEFSDFQWMDHIRLAA